MQGNVLDRRLELAAADTDHATADHAADPATAAINDHLLGVDGASDTATAAARIDIDIDIRLLLLGCLERVSGRDGGR